MMHSLTLGRLKYTFLFAMSMLFSGLLPLSALAVSSAHTHVGQAVMTFSHATSLLDKPRVVHITSTSHQLKSSTQTGRENKKTALTPIFTQYEIPTQYSESTGIDAGVDKAIWFSEVDGARIGRVTDTGVFTEFVLPAHSDARRLVALNNGTIWFTDLTNGKVEELVPFLKLLFIYNLPDGAKPFGITASPEETIWVTDYAHNALDRLKFNTNVLTTYPIPTPNAQPLDLIAGSDSTVWFTELYGNKIGHIAANGDITEFAVPTLNSKPTGLTMGSDGNLWFVEQAGNKIGRFNIVSRLFKEIPIPTPSSRSLFIVALREAQGPVRAAFTEYEGNKIGIVNDDESISEFTVPTADAGPYAITATSSGDLWFLEAHYRANHVTRLTF
ncbi:Vgb family protein [Dictyobacter arantiisoli]|uniref:Virginiamycin B lyase n=1 Tax=Dictyobacter arantiisoli TaxID=2014874 RepID=A0A5A5TFC3_9CHLR|nr:hypothetical protein [Dictyobacter arantiisoli]GCF09915.1 hypothetical protein KDI_34790 [Dictyobacter arantiisoli]